MKNILARILVLIIIGMAVCAKGQTVSPTYSFTDFSTHPTAVMRLCLTPLQPFADYNGALLTASPICAVNVIGTNTYTFTNIISGYTYRVECDTSIGPPTFYTNGYPSGLSGPVNAANYRGVWIGQVFAWIHGPLATGTNDGLLSSNLFTEITTLSNSFGGFQTGSQNLTNWGQFNTNQFASTNQLTAATNGAAATATAAINSLAVLKANNGSDFTSARGAGTNVGPLIASPVGGSSPSFLADMLNAVPKYEGQIVVGYGSQKRTAIAVAGSTASNDLHDISFPTGVEYFGSQSNMDVNAVGSITMDFNGNRANYNRSGDAVLIARNWSTNNNSTGFGAARMGKDPVTGLPVVLGPVDDEFLMNPTNILASLGAGWASWTVNPGVNVLINSPNVSGFDSGNYACFAGDFTHKIAGIPFWQSGAYEPYCPVGVTNQSGQWIWALSVSMDTATVGTYSNLNVGGSVTISNGVTFAGPNQFLNFGGVNVLLSGSDLVISNGENLKILTGSLNLPGASSQAIFRGVGTPGAPTFLFANNDYINIDASGNMALGIFSSGTVADYAIVITNTHQAVYVNTNLIVTAPITTPVSITQSNASGGYNGYFNASNGVVTANYLAFTNSASPTVNTNGTVAGGGAGVGAVFSLDANANNTRGRLTIVTGGALTANSLACNVAMNPTLPTTPEVYFFQPESASGGVAPIRFYITNAVTTNFQVWSTATSPTVSTTNTYHYFLVF